MLSLVFRSSGKIKAVAQATAQIGIVLLALVYLVMDASYLGIDFASFDKSGAILSGIGWWFMVMANSYHLVRCTTQKNLLLNKLVSNKSPNFLFRIICRKNNPDEMLIKSVY